MVRAVPMAHIMIATCYIYECIYRKSVSACIAIFVSFTAGEKQVGNVDDPMSMT